MLSYFFSSSLTSSCSASLAAVCLARRTAAILSIQPSVTARLCFKHMPCISLRPCRFVDPFSLAHIIICRQNNHTVKRFRKLRIVSADITQTLCLMFPSNIAASSSCFCCNCASKFIVASSFLLLSKSSFLSSSFSIDMSYC